MQNNIRSCKEVKSLTVWMTDKNKHASRIRSPRLESQPLLLWEQTCCRIPNAIQCLWLQIPQQHATDVRISAQENRCATTSWWVYWSLWQDIAAMSKHLSYMSYYSQESSTCYPADPVYILICCNSQINWQNISPKRHFNRVYILHCNCIKYLYTSEDWRHKWKQQ